MATAFRAEIEANFKAFEQQWPKDQHQALNAIGKASNKFVASYVRIASIQAWRVLIIQDAVDDDSAAFFFEAQNDLLVSHCLARSGSFRQALKGLRSAIENVYFALYYMDHPVELKKWELGQHKLTFTELQAYFSSHPALFGVGGADSGLDTLKDEYSILSKAVHGSAKQFRMTHNLSDIQLWASDLASVGKWETRERYVVIALNTLLAHVFKDKLTGAQRTGLRQALGLVIPKSRQQYFKSNLGVTLIIA